EVVSSSTAGAS
ncbi:unnamed protein product, partial [Rotaria sordida]